MNNIDDSGTRTHRSTNQADTTENDRIGDLETAEYTYDTNDIKDTEHFENNDNSDNSDNTTILRILITQILKLVKMIQTTAVATKKAGKKRRKTILFM